MIWKALLQGAFLLASSSTGKPFNWFIFEFMHSYTNHLINETSPYLLQHAHNPVNWYPWSEQAFERAKTENKPVLVSIGYAACHWCHVMERESFENPEVASIMNDNFINIKVDREERPDVDHIYMDAVQAITGSGGWPLNVFLTPERKPFYGGTYFPPRRAFNRASWTEVLLSIAQTFKEKRQDVEQQADTLTEHLHASNSFGFSQSSSDQVFSEKNIHEAFENCMKSADREWGGFGRAPKFPQTFTLQFLLNYYQVYKNDEALKQAVLSLDKMIQGGIYDHIGGGFARYSTDTEWLVPHFEKMLYDNALLVSTLSTAYRVTKNERYKAVIEETLAFVERELMHKRYGFFSALDADSEGEEGKYYVWSATEVKKLLKEEADQFSTFFNITETGNWEGKNIPWIKTPWESFIREKNLDHTAFEKLIKSGKAKLLQARETRIRPLLDDKVLLGWNSLMNLAYSQAYGATGNRHYKEIAERNMNFLLAAFTAENNGLHHTWKDEKATYPAFLDDYSNLIAALLELGQVTSDIKWLNRAYELTEYVIRHFEDETSSFFFYTSKEQKDLLLRKKEVYDGATPSGNAVMASNLYKLSIIFDHSQWKERSHNLLTAIGEVTTRYPTSFGVWLNQLFEIIKGTNEIAVIGNNWEIYLEEILRLPIPHKLVMASARPDKNVPLLANKAVNDETLIYLCKNYSCLNPVNTITDLQKIL